MPEGDKQEQIISSMADLQEEETLELVRQAMAEGMDPLHILDLCDKGMTLVGERYEQGRFYISGLIMAGQIMRQVGQLVLPLIENKVTGGESGRIVLGTVQGDIHDIGKDIFKVLVRSHGFTVHDLGVDVPPSNFLAAVNELKPDIVGLSCLLNTAYNDLKKTIMLLREATLKEMPPKAYIIGGLIDEDVCTFVKSDYWTTDAMEGVRLCQHIMQETGEETLDANSGTP